MIVILLRRGCGSGPPGVGAGVSRGRAGCSGADVRGGVKPVLLSGDGFVHRRRSCPQRTGVTLGYGVFAGRLEQGSPPGRVGAEQGRGTGKGREWTAPVTSLMH
nr:hypothetical protein GCM10020241_14280 [Streptoalloteichus tenebrarius]